MDVKRVLYITYDGLTDPLGQSQILPYLKGLSECGYSFTILSFEKKKRFLQEESVIAKITKEANIEWVPLGFTKRPPFFAKLYDLYRMKKTAKLLHRRRRFHMVHCRSYVAANVGLYLKERFGVKFIFDMRGFWADERKEGGLWNLNNPFFRLIYRYFKRREMQFLCSADYTIALTENAKREMLKWDAKEQFAPIEVIPCCVDLRLFDPSLIDGKDVSDLKRELNIKPEQIVISYIGSIGTWYMTDEMFDFFERFLYFRPDSVFVLITKDSELEIRRKASEKKIQSSSLRVISASRSQMPLLISLSDFSIFFIKPLFSKKASSPTKQGEIMAMGVPLICNDNIGDTSNIVNVYKAGMVVNDFSATSYNALIDRILKTEFDKSLIRNGANVSFSLEKGVQKYASVYDKVLRS